MGSWYLSLGISLFLVLVGLYTHWLIILLGALLPLMPMISFLLARRAQRLHDAGADEPDGR